jgi:hypothetical protein
VTGTITAAGAYSVVEAALNDTSGAAAFHTTANGATSTTSPLVVNNAGPAATFFCQIEDEVISVTAGGTTTSWTVTRGSGLVGATTTNINHATGSDIGRNVGNYFTSATFAAVGLSTNDSVAYTWQVKLT